MAKIETTVTPVVVQPDTLRPVKFQHTPIIVTELEGQLSFMRGTESLPSIKQILQNKPQFNVEGYDYTKMPIRSSPRLVVKDIKQLRNNKLLF
jgi:hypothetical protein